MYELNCNTDNLINNDGENIIHNEAYLIETTAKINQNILISDESKKTLNIGNDLNNNLIKLVPSNSKTHEIPKQTNYNDDFNLKFQLSSSPAPIRKTGSCLFDFDNKLNNPKSIYSLKISSLK